MKPEKMVKQLIAAKDAYYAGNPVMLDSEFDTLEDSLREADPSNPYFDVVGASVSDRTKVQHAIQMLSLDKVKTVEGAISWIKKMGLGLEEFVVEPKIDGLSCSVTYKDGELVRIATRGDGRVGQDVTHIAKFVKSIPKKLASVSSAEVRGELYLPKGSKFPNPDSKPLRNLAVGLVNRKDGLEDLGFVQFVAYQCFSDGHAHGYEHEKLEWLERSKFKVVDFNLILSEGLEGYYKRYLDSLRDEWPYETDGLVLVVNDTELWSSLDEKYLVSHHHHYNMAIKPPSVGKETILKVIQWSVTRLGRVVPVAVVEPVTIGGATITRCSLNNVEYVENLGLRIGDRVTIERANDVIPYFKQNLESHSVDKKLIPKNCPSCGSTLYREGVQLVCKNDSCTEKVVQKILYWVKVCEMDHMSESFVRRMVGWNKISSIKDLYLLTEKDFEGMDGFGDISIENALSQISSSREMSVRQFVVRLGVNGIGQKAMEKLGVNSFRELLTFKDSSSVIGRTLTEFVKDNKKFIEELASALKIFAEIPKKKGMLNVCMTGTGPLPRKELISRIEEMGFTFVDHVGKDTNILVCEDVEGTSSKLAKAKSLGVKLMSYEDFLGKGLHPRLILTGIGSAMDGGKRREK
jgi:DNA ligase (NAD+)